MANDQPRQASYPSRIQPSDAPTSQSINLAPFGDAPDSQPQERDPIQHIRDRTAKRQNQLPPRSESVTNSFSSPKPFPKFRKQSEPTPLHKGSRASSESVQFVLDDTNDNTSPMLSQARQNEPIELTEEFIDTPLATGVSINFRSSDVSPPAFVSGQPASSDVNSNNGVLQAERAILDAAKEKIQKQFRSELAAVWLGEMISNAIIRYYQGKRGELIEGLTRATRMAQQYGAKDLMARAQLWKAIIFDEMGYTANIAAILGDILSLVRDFGDEMDCYQLRKLLPVYAHEIFQYLLKQARANEEPSSATGFNSPASRSTFEAWFQYQVLSLEKKYNYQNWPDPSIARDAAHVKKLNSAPAFQNKPKPEDMVSPGRATKEDSSGSSANTALLKHMMVLEDKLKNKEEEHAQLVQEILAELNRYKAIVEDLERRNTLSENRAVAAGPNTRPGESKPSRAFSAAISPGQITAVNEILKAGRPRSRQTPQSDKPDEVPINAHSEEWSHIPNEVQIQRWRDEHRPNSGSTVSRQREPFGTPTHVQSIYNSTRTDSMASLVVGSSMSSDSDRVRPPQPLKIRNPDGAVMPSGSMQNHRKPVQSRARSRLKRTHDERRSESRSSPRRVSRAVASSNWRIPEELFLSTSTSSTASATSEDKDIDQIAHDIPQGPSGPRLLPRRSSLPSPSLVSPLTIDPHVELPLTDTPSPTRLRHTISAFRDLQEQRKRSASVAISPTSMSYEAERRRSHIASELKAQEDRKRKENMSTEVSGDMNPGMTTDGIQCEGKNVSAANGDVEVSIAVDTTLMASSNPPSNKLSLGKRGISVGHGTAITGMSVVLSASAQDPQLVYPTPSSDEAVSPKKSEAQQDTDTSPVDLSDSDLTLSALDSSDGAQSSALSATKDADVDTDISNRVHHRQGSFPAVPSPLREASGADDLEIPVKDTEKLVAVVKSRQLSVRDFAYNQGSETSDLYGISEDEVKTPESSGSIAKTTGSSLQFKSLDKNLITATNQTTGTTSPIRLSKLYEDIENGYPSPITDEVSSSSSGISTADSWPSDGTSGVNTVPGLNLDHLLRHRQNKRDQALDGEDESISPTSKPMDKLKTTPLAEKTNQHQGEATREAVLDMASRFDVEEELRVQWIADVQQAALEKMKKEEENRESTQESISGKFSMETVDSDDTETERPEEKTEEHGIDGLLEILLPKTYVPLSQEGSDQTDVEIETPEQREDMKKELWNQGII